MSCSNNSGYVERKIKITNDFDVLGNEIKAGHACFGTPIVIFAGMRGL